MRDQLSDAVIGAAIEVHRMLGPGLLESAYEECLCRELTLRQILFERQVPLPVIYKDVKLECGYRMDIVVSRMLVVEVKSVDAKMVVDAMQKIANRITSGLILAALIMGASLLMRIETAFRIFGYPGLAMLCFLAAAGGGFWLVISIVIQDQKSRKKIGGS